MSTKKSVVMGLSGGMDSATVLAYYYNKGYKIHPIFFYYGSKHNKYELECSKKLAEYFHTESLRMVNLDFIQNLFKSNLLQNQGEIPEGYYTDSNMSLTVVPGRNSIFATIMAGYAESIGADTIALGVHAGDHCIPASELIMTEFEKIPMEFLEVGNKVLSQNLETGRFSFESVTKKVNNGLRQDILEIDCTLGRTIKATSNHKFFKFIKSDKSVKEVEAQDLEVGDWLLTPGAHSRRLKELQKDDILPSYTSSLKNQILSLVDTFTRRNDFEYITKSKILKEQVSWLATIMGYSIDININNYNSFDIKMMKNPTKNMGTFADSMLVQIKNIKEAMPETVYDIEVENNHNFFAGSGSGILVSNSIYPDCRPIFISAMNTAIMASTEEKVHIEAPILYLNKAGILKMGYSFPTPVPYEYTRTCYKDQELSCGKCASCSERLESFELIGKVDPIKYAE